MKNLQFPNNEKIDFSKKLRVKFGIDPTSDKLHLGHLIPLLKVKELIRDGHHIDIVLGTFTAQLGDPSGKDTMRPILTREQTSKNADSISKQINRILGDKFHMLENSFWFEIMTAVEMIDIISKFTTTQLLSRDSFQKRMEAKNPIGMHELIVPILQGFDSVQLNSDLEIGGTDQLFNFGITRDVQRSFGQAPEICLLMPIINGTDGRKMSKSFDNCIFLNDTPQDVFGKTMSISDDLMKEWWPVIFGVDFPTVENPWRYNILDIRPMTLKKDLAFKVTEEIWGKQSSIDAHLHFMSVIQENNMPKEIREVPLGEIVDIVKSMRECSKSEAIRLLKAGAVSVKNSSLDELGFEKIISETKLLTSGMIVKVGKRDFAKLKNVDKQK